MLQGEFDRSKEEREQILTLVYRKAHSNRFIFSFLIVYCLHLKNTPLLWDSS